MTTATLESLLEGAVHNLRTEQTSSPAEAPAPESDPKSGDGQAEPKPVETGADTDGPPPSHEDEPTDAEGRLKALIGERKKRQETEQKLGEREKEFAELQKRIKELEDGKPQPQQQRPAQQPVAAPDPWLDPEGYARHIQAETEKRSFRDRVEISQELMRSKHEDYDEVEKVFREECKSNPYLAQQLRTSPFPARFAYEQGKRLKALQEIGDDPAAFRAKVEADLKAKIEAEQAAKPTAPSPVPAAQAAASPAPQPPPPPPSLAGVTSSAPRKAASKFEGPTPLDAILK